MEMKTKLQGVAGALFLSMLFVCSTLGQGAGSLDTTFGDPFGVGDGKVVYTPSPWWGLPKDIAVQSDGKIVCVSGPTGPNATVTLIRLNSDGSLDTSFNGTGTRSFQWGLTYKNTLYPGSTWAVGFQDIGGSERILVAGKNSKLVGKSVVNFVRVDRFMADGSTDTSFGNNGTFNLFEGEVYDLVVQPDRKIVGVTQGTQKVFRLTENGTLDPTFASGGMFTGDGTLQRLALDPDGSILVVSTVPSGSGRNANINIRVRKYDSSGTLVSTFGTSGAATFARSSNSFVPKSITVDSDHNILIGTRAWVTGGQDFAAVRFTGDGLVDSDFASNGLYLAGYSTIDSRISTALMQSDRKILLIGNSYNSGGGPVDAVVIRLNYDGSVDTGFGISGISSFDIGGNDAVSNGPGGVIQIDPVCYCEKILVTSSGSGFSTSFARLNTF